MPGPQDGQRPGRTAQGRAAKGQGGAARQLRGRRSGAAAKAFDLFVASYGAQYPKAVECLSKDREALLVLYGFPTEHWRLIRTTNPIEATFATVRVRHGRSKGSGSRVACLTMVFKLMKAASKKWRMVNGSSRLTDVIRGVRFVDGIEVKDAA